jgi:N-acetylmuramoyl-L-alanine amidase
MLKIVGSLRIFALAALLMVGWVFSAGARPEATAVRLGAHDEVTRFVLEVTEPIGFRIFTLPSPYRVVIDMPELRWTLPEGGEGTGAVARYRAGLFKPGTWRVVLDVTSPVRVKHAYLIEPSDGKPHRFVVDLAPVTAEAFASTVGSVASVGSNFTNEQDISAVPPVLPPVREPDAKRVVVIDPGHGGIDPGATGVTGSREKRITLQVARELKRRLEATGRYEVVLTRDSDVFVRLRERVASAQRAGADFLISLHADSIDNRNVQGASIYTLSKGASDKEAGQLAAKENKSDIIAGLDLSEYNDNLSAILIDLTQGITMNDSARFANMLIDEMRQATTVLQKTHRFAGFAVLKAPDIPSVLIEMGYLSNQRDEKNLTSKTHQGKIAAAIVRAIDIYFARLEELSRS